ncbi:MAG: tRNA-dihydrouridine synthase family protein [Victivallaceae bacterium]|nr:tRNA-dihydrouridine synthase family protein [Victivallaceae bacterium]
MADEVLYPEENAVLMAPLSGYTDLPYRHSLRRHQCRYAFTEMVDAAALLYARDRTFGMLRRGADESFLGVQLVGADANQLAEATKILNDFDFSVLDFNLGCPVPKVAKKGAGAALGREIDKAIRCFTAIRENSRFPVTAKIRILSETEEAPTLELAEKLQNAGAEALTVHGRIQKAYYSGTVFSQVIRSTKEHLHIPVIANGGVLSVADYDRLRSESGCSRVMIARGAMGNPWIFSAIVERENYHSPSFRQWKQEVLLHLSEMTTYFGEEPAMRMARKIMHDYMKGRGFPGVVRSGASTMTTLRELDRLLEELERNQPEHFRDPSLA